MARRRESSPDELQRLRARIAVLERRNEPQPRAEPPARERVRELVALQMLNRRLFGTASFEERIRAALAEVLGAARADVALLYLRDGNSLRLRGVYTRNAGFSDSGAATLMSEACACGRAARDGKSVFCDGATGATPRGGTACPCTRHCSVAALPLRVGQQTIGVLTLGSASRQDYAERGVFLETLACTVAAGFHDVSPCVPVPTTPATASTAASELPPVGRDPQLSQNAWRAVFDVVAHPVVILDLEQRIVLANNAVIAATGAPESELIGKRCYEVFHGPTATGPAPGCPFEQPTVSRTHATAEMEVQALNGVYLVACTPLLDEQNRVTKVVHVATDITERKRMEVSLRISEGRYRELVNRMSSGVVVYRAVRDGADFVIVDFNRAAERIEQVAKADVIGRRVTEAFPGIEAMGLLDVFRDVWRSGTEAHLPITMYRDERIAGWRDNFVYRLPSGEVVAVYDDLTERKRVEEERNRLFELSTDLFCVATTGGLLKDVNPAWVKTLGYQREELLSRPFREIVHADDPLPCDVGVPAPGASSRPVEILNRCRQKDGALRTIVWAVTPVPSERLVYCVGRDVTERERAVAEHARLEAQLRQAQKMEAVGQLAGGVAHDFNNILTAILGNVELTLAELELSTPRNDLLLEGVQQIELSAQKATTLTRQLLAFSRHQVLQTQVLDLNRTLVELEALLRRLVTESITLTVSQTSGLSNVSVDRGRIEQVIMNLVVNARDAMPDGGKLTIETANVVLDEDYVTLHAEARSGPHVVLTVSDTGCGMDGATAERIFEPFFTTKDLGAGTGLGLAMVYGIVKQAGGHITVYSEPGHGATFRVYLPAVAAAADETLPAEAEQGSLCGTETILVCEDDQTIRDLTARVLTDAGYRVIAAPNGALALQLITRRPAPINLLVTDVIMPNMNGKKLSEAVTEIQPGVRTLFISGYTANVIAHHGVLDEGVELLQKPFSRRALLERVRAMLDRQSPAPE